MLIPVWRDRTQKPPMGVSLRSDGHWSVQGLVGAWAFNEGAGQYVLNSADQKYGGITEAVWKSNGLYFGGSGYVNVHLPTLDWQSTGVTILALVDGLPGEDASRSVFGAWNSADTNKAITLGQIRYTPYGRAIAIAGRQYEANSIEIYTSAAVLSARSIAGVFAPSYGSIYVDGVLSGTDASVSNYGSLGFDTYRIGYSGGSRYAGYWVGVVRGAVAYSRTLTPTQNSITLRKPLANLRARDCMGSP